MLVNMSGGKKVENIINEIVEPVLLWTNPNPSSNFAAQTVSLASGYDAYLVECKNAPTGYDIRTTTFIPFFTGTGAEDYRVVFSYYYAGNRRYNDGRVVTSAQDGKIVFGKSFEGGGGGSSATGDNENRCIPTRIWGVKYTL